MQLLLFLMESTPKWRGREAEIYAQIGRAAYGAANLPGYDESLSCFVLESGFEALGDREFWTYQTFSGISARLEELQQEACELSKLDDARYAAHLRGAGWWRWFDTLTLEVRASNPVDLGKIADDCATAFNRAFSGARSVHRPTQRTLLGYRSAQPLPAHPLFTYASDLDDRRVLLEPRLEGLHAIGITRPAIEQFLERYIGRLQRGNWYFPK